MYKLEDIKTLHLELTEKCQAGCPLCARHSSDGSLNPEIINAELSISNAMKFFPRSFVKQLNRMFMCGNYGDPIIGKHTIEIFEYFRYNNPSMCLDMHTNGGARTTDWWKDLAYILYNENSWVTFSFDGLEDTNHIYRKNVNWDIAMNSAKSFIEAGGNAVWSFLVFRHNEHQVEEAKALSEKMGFKKFVAKKSARSSSENHPYIQAPSNPQYLNRHLPHVDKINLNTTEINCMTVQQKSIYVSARGLLFPCCWTGGIHNQWGHSLQLKEFFGNLDNIDLNKQTMKEIFDSGIFERVKKSWSCKSVAEGRLQICAKTCSKEYNSFQAQFT